VKRVAFIVVLCLVACVTWSGGADDELARAQQRAYALSFVNSLGVTVEQAQAMIQPLQRIQGYLEQYQEAQEAAVSKPEVVAACQQARLALMAGQEISADTRATINKVSEDLEAARQALYASVNNAMRTIAGILTVEQNAKLDWTPPGVVRGAPTAQQRAQLQREIDARVRDGVAMLDRVKFLDPLNFVTARMPIIEEYLAINQNQGAALPANAMEICLYYTDQARMVPLEEWQMRAPGLAAQMVSQLGLMPTLDPKPRADAIGWWSLYQLFTSPETLAVMQEIPQTRRR